MQASWSFTALREGSHGRGKNILLHAHRKYLDYIARLIHEIFRSVAKSNKEDARSSNKNLDTNLHTMRGNKYSR